MSITVTTLTNAIDSHQQTMVVGSNSGFSASAQTPTVAIIDDELVNVRSVSSTLIGIERGMGGTRATAHGATRAVLVGSPGDFEALAQWWNAGQSFRFGNGLFIPSMFPSTRATATSITVTAGEVLNGFILDDPSGGAQTATLPTAALMVAACPGAQIGSTIRFIVRNTADASETITVAAGTGGTVTGGGTMTIAQNAQKEFLLRFTGVTPGNEAYTLYSMGSVTF